MRHPSFTARSRNADIAFPSFPVLQAKSLKASFRYTPWLQSKPVIDPESPGDARNPFVDPDRRYIVLCPALDKSARPTHRMLINKYPVYRPQLLLTTIAAESQAANLSKADFEATRTVLEQLHADSTASDNHSKTEWMAIYNCGQHSGNSQPHKHLQVFPIPGASGEKDIMPFPERHAKRKDLQEIGMPTAKPSVPKCYADRSVPFVHFLSYFDANGVDPAIPATRRLGETYGMLLSLAIRTLAQVDVPPPASYNLLFTRRWMLLIPRRASCGKDTGSPRQGPMVNAMGMAGIVWLNRKEVKQEWLSIGIGEHLKACGLGWDKVDLD
jgi:sulfate adenylyltransferase (ADP) / ATP adenylyltransferase